MFVSGMNTCNYSHNNNPTKQKTYTTFVSNLIYIFMYLYVSQFLAFIKIIYFSCEYIIYIHVYLHG